jgi:Cu/Zn superoxide dismutase
MSTGQSRHSLRPVGAALATLIVASTALVACSSSETAPAPPTFAATLSAANERPNPVTSLATGSATVVKNGTTYTYTVNYTGLSGAPSAAHIHGPANTTVAAGVLVNFSTAGAAAASGTLTGTFTATDIVSARGVTGDSLDVLLRTGNAYVNVHTPTNGGGEIRGQLLTR